MLVTPLTTSVVATTTLVTPVDVIVISTLVVALDNTVVGFNCVMVLKMVDVLPPDTTVVNTDVAVTPTLVRVTCPILVIVVGNK
jgi:hypothetical protein